MSIRWKFALALGGLAAVAAIAASAAGYLAARDRLIGQIDRSIAQTAERAALGPALGQGLGDGAPPPADPLQGGAVTGPPSDSGNLPPLGAGPRRGGPDAGGGFGNRLAIIQTLDSNGKSTPRSGIKLPVDKTDLQIANSSKPGRVEIRGATVDGISVRIATAAIPGGGAIQVARRVGEANAALSNLKTELILITIAVIAIALLLGLLLSRTVTAPLERLTATAERVAATGAPDAEVTVSGNDEVGRLGRAFSQMLSALSRSQAQQQQLVEDAGHELRTPLTSLRTNIAVLKSFDRLGPEDQTAVIADLQSEAGELSALVDELVDLTQGGNEETEQEVQLDRLAAHAAERAKRRTGRDVTVTAEPVRINGRPRALDRAITNLLDNAAKFDDSDGPIELSLTKDRLEVLDRGPGIPEDQREAVFERFHRTVEARNLPGSGLGLAIVRETAKRHGGDAYAQGRDGGGSVVGFTFAVQASE